MDRELNEEELQALYAWIDSIPLSRPKKHIRRDFSDGVMAAEVVKYFFPKLVDLRNYVSANSTQQKLSNWNFLNRNVFSKLNFHVPEETVRRIVVSTEGVIEPVLSALRERLDKKREQATENIADLEYYNTRNQRNPNPEIRQTEPQQHATQFDSDMDPALRLFLKEKEQTIMDLQETVAILQRKVNRLEHLVELKNLRIEDLTQHLESFKAGGNVCR